MDYWTSGPGWQQLAADLVAADQRGCDERAAVGPRRRTGRARRAVAGALVALAARLAPAEAPATGSTTPAPGAARP